MGTREAARALTADAFLAAGASPRKDDAAPRPSDEAHLLRIACGDDEDAAAEAFAALYRRWQAPIYRFAVQMGGSDSVAEDVMQEVFVALVEDGHRFDPAKGQFSSYLFAIARNLLRRRLRREGIYEAIEDDPDAGHSASDVRPPAGVMDPAAALDRSLAIHAVRRAVAELPVTFREAVVLCDLQELSYADAAVALGCPVGTVRSRLHRGRLLLAERLGPDRGHRGRGTGGER